MENMNDVITAMNSRGERQHHKEGVEYVGMNEAKTIDVSQSKEGQELRTNGVGGCTIVAVLAKTADGRTLAHLSHFEQHGVDFQKSHLQLLRQRNDLKSMTTKIITRGNWEKQGEKWTMIPKSTQEVSSLREAAGSLSETSVMAYSEKLEDVFGQDQSNTHFVSFVLIPNEDGTFQAELRWWGGATEHFE